MTELHVAADLALPVDYVTKTVGILAQRRKGKTYTASVIAEEFVDNGLPFVALDPTGAWWGLRASADGEHEGLPVTILGGEHGDVPLNRTDGKGVAELVVDEPGWYVIDFSLFESNAAEVEFATDFAHRLYRRKGQPNSDFPLHLFVDEADRFVPQRPKQIKGEGSETSMLGAFEAIVRRGGLRGLGTTLISQRSAVVNKNVLEQVDVLIVLRTVGPNDRQRVQEIVSAEGTPEQIKELMGSVASLDLGEAWFWEPGEGAFQRIHIRPRRTFNSSATPKPGEKRVEPRRLASVDLEAIKERWAEQIERVKADDPKELRKRIAVLERQLRDAEAAKPEPEVHVERVEIPVVPEATARLFGEACGDLQAMVSMLGEVASGLTGGIDALSRAADGLRHDLQEATRDHHDAPRARPSGGGARAGRLESGRAAQSHTAPARREPRRAPVPRPAAAAGDVVVGGGAPMKILAVVAQYPEGCPKARAAMLAGTGQKKSTLRNALSALRGASYITGSDVLFATEAGLAALGGEPEPLPTGDELLAHWRGQLNPTEAACFDVLVDAWPDEVGRLAMAEAVDIDPEKSTLRNAMSRLRVLGVAHGWRLDDDLAEAIGRG